MFILFVLIFENFQYFVEGNWSDSPPIFETLHFFQYLHPDFLPKLNSIFQNSQLFTVDHILSQLRSSLSPTLFGLLNLSLRMRIFHPKAALTHPIPNRKPLLCGWGLQIPYSIPHFNLSQFQWKVISHLFNEQSIERRFTFLQHVSHRFQDVVPQLQHLEVRGEIVKEFNRLNLPHDQPLSLLNGRVLSDDPIEIVDAMLSEISKYFDHDFSQYF